MNDRIGALHMHYRTSAAPLAQAASAGVTHAVAAGLGDALAQRLRATIGDGKEVLVLREVRSRVRLGTADCALDSQVVERISRAAAQAVAGVLAANPSGDMLMRFEDQHAFIGAFVMALLDGSAWDRWYLGAFSRFRHANPAATLRAVLGEPGVEVGAVLGWLARRGQLTATLALLPAREARCLLGATASVAAPSAAVDGSAVLADAARALLLALAPDAQTLTQLEARVDDYLAGAPLAPDWTSRASLSVWVMQAVRFALRWPDGPAPPLPISVRETVAATLAGQLDWLDGPWITTQLFGAASAAASPAPRRHLLTPRQSRVLEQLAQAVAGNAIALSGGEDEIVVRLLAHAAMDAALGDDRTIVAVVGRAAQVFVSARKDAAGDAVLPLSAPAAAAGDIAALRAAGPAAQALLDAMLGADAGDRDGFAPSDCAGIFLLARAVSDFRLPALARQHGLPLAPLLAALGEMWSGLAGRGDPALTLWRGDEEAELAAGDDRIAPLNAALMDMLVARRVLDEADAVQKIEADAADLGGTPLSATACMLLRGWSSWLPGVADSAPLFLLRRCVRRAGAIRVREHRIELELDPAPLDIVLQMAGYLAPIEQVDWLGARKLSFTLRKHAGEPAP